MGSNPFSHVAHVLVDGTGFIFPESFVHSSVGRVIADEVEVWSKSVATFGTFHSDGSFSIITYRTAVDKYCRTATESAKEGSKTYDNFIGATVNSLDPFI